MSQANPKKIDYNKDQVVDQYDDELARQDLNKDGAVTSKEKAESSRRQRTTTQEIVTDPKTGRQTVKSVGAEPAPEPTMTAEGLGFSEQFLKANEDVRAAIRLAIENKWPQEVLNRYIENNTNFGKATTDAQAEFDIRIQSGKAEDLERDVADKFDYIKRQVALSGVNVSDDEIRRYARESIRSKLSDQDMLGFISQRFSMPQTAAGQPAMSAQGQSSVIMEEIRKMARSYGVTVTDADLQNKVREALSFGGQWQSWLEGQRNTFRQQAKTLYPTVSNLLDQSDLATVMNPYMSDAADLLGISITNMNVGDPLWQTALNGPNGPMSRDEWIRVLRTDSRYGYDRTVRARQEYASLADELLSAFGMA
jgi:osmotically-inducible protein OsmY